MSQRSSSSLDLRSERFQRPVYRISPFRTQDITGASAIHAAQNHHESSVFSSLNRYPAHTFCASGREAISIALEEIGLQREDKVTIVTTTGSDYISSCVSDAVEKICGWNRVVNNESKAILVIHEFGKLYRDSERLLKHGLPIIEDCAYAMYSLIKPELFFGDYLVFSLSKYLPILKGGLLLSKTPITSPKSADFFSEQARSVFLHHECELENIGIARKEIARKWEKMVSEFGCFPLFELLEDECPGAFLFEAVVGEGRLQGLKELLQEMSIECGVFYGNNAFFLPCHQYLSEIDIEYIGSLMQQTGWNHP